MDPTRSIHTGAGKIARHFGPLLRVHFGLHFPPERTEELVHGADAAAQSLGLEDAAALASAPLPLHTVLDALRRHVTVGETYFFREPAAFEALEREIVPALLKARGNCGGTLRIWSAACASGEEPYSIAIAMRRILAATPEWNVRILGTDLNPDSIVRARAAVFRPWSFRCVPEAIRETCFRPAPDGLLELDERIARTVEFRESNLAGPLSEPPGSMDIVFCRNALMYFAEDAAAAVLAGFVEVLATGGWLVLGTSEDAHPDGMERIPWPGANLFRKEAQPSASRPPRRVAAANSANSAEAAPSPGDRARGFANRGNLPAALAHCDEAIAADRLNPALHHLRAAILEEQGEWQAAKAALEQAVLIDPDFLAGHFALGMLALRTGAHAISTDHFRNAMRLADRYDANEEIPDAGGISAGRLREVIHSMLHRTP